MSAEPTRTPSHPLWTSILPLTLGVAMTLALAGYRFGESNHAVYLVDALRHNDPNLLANDWWTRSTLQYHVVFTRLSAWLMRIDLIEPAFLTIYIGLVILMHLAWRGLAHALGGCDNVYLVSVIFFQLMAAGTGLGMYQFLQDSSLLPSNIANVAMLLGVYLWVRGRAAWAGFAFGAAGLFHLNHALAGIGLWVGLQAKSVLCQRFSPSPWYSGERVGERGPKELSSQPLTLTLSPDYRGEGTGSWLIGMILLIAMASVSIVPALQSVLAKSASMPLNDFVDLYVRLRHPHHYDPSSWPAALWVTFFLPVVAAVLAHRLAPRTIERNRGGDTFVLFMAMLAVALLCAGLYFISEPLIQMSLYRFSIYPKLLGCIAGAWLVWRSAIGQLALRTLVFGMLAAFTGLMMFAHRFEDLPPFLISNAFAIWLFALLASVALLRPRVQGWGRPAFGALAAGCVVVSMILTWHKLGIVHEGIRGDDAGYLAACDWARKNTPVDSVFLVPPDEQSFRLHARRAIVVNFKNVPQLGSELGEWRDRLQNVLDVPDLRRALPTPFPRTLATIRKRYAELPPEHLAGVAQQYGARYVLTVRPIPSPAIGKLVFSDTAGRYFLYDLH